MSIEKIKKRDGFVADFDRTKLERAIEKACIASKTSIDKDVITLIIDDVISAAEIDFAEKIPGVEDIQDLIERKIAERGLFDVAKTYILYRRDRQIERAQQREKLLNQIKQSELKVKDDDGTLIDFDLRKLESTIQNCCQGFENKINVHQLLEKCLLNIYDGISKKEITTALVMTTRANIEKDPSYSYLSARFLFNGLYQDILKIDEFSNSFTEIYKETFISKTKESIEQGRIDSRLLDFDLERLSEEILPERDKLFNYLGAQTLYDRYFLRDHDQNIIETPQYFWMRVAMGLSLNEANKNEKAIEFYHMISSLYYVPSTPTLFHSGTNHPQMSSCYLTTVEDDLAHIFKCIGDNAALSKWSGGLGNDWTNIRGTGSLIKSTNVGSQGVIPFLKIVDGTTAAINRSGKRRGATCVYLETWHYDIEAFLELRKNTGDDRRRTHDTNTCNWIPDLFMKRVINNEEWTLISPDEAPDLHHIYGKEFEEKYIEYERKIEQGEIKFFKKIQAVDLWRKMITQLFETGHPWITFKDPCNIRSPQDHVGVVHSSNLCTEITLNTSAQETAVCNLGSINLSKHVENGQINYDQLKRTILTAMRMLDNVIDLNFYPIPEAENSNLKHRPVGLGIMGLQDAFYKLDMHFDSHEAVKASDELQEFISYHAILSSSTLAKEKGAYSSYQGSKWDRGIFPIDTLMQLETEREMSTEVDFSHKLDWDVVKEHVKAYGMRNSNCMAIAPTATISNIAGCLPTIEPIYKNMYVKSNVSGEFTVINSYLIEDLKKINLWNEDIMEKVKFYDGSLQKIKEIPESLRNKYKEVFEIDPVWLIKHAAQRGKWIDQSQSLNIFTDSQSGKQIAEIYITAWRMGLKTTYYLRTLAASSIEKSTLDINKSLEQPPKPSASEQLQPQLRKVVIEDAICEACQ